MKLASLTALITAAWASAAVADASGFAQLRQVQRLADTDCAQLSGCKSMSQEAMGELLLEQRVSDSFSASLRIEALSDRAVHSSRVRAREVFVDWAPGTDLSLRLGRQILTWGVSDYLYVNDVFPKNHDSFLTGGGFDRMKDPVDAGRISWRVADLDVETVVARAKGDRAPDPQRFAAMLPTRQAMEAVGTGNGNDVAVKVSGHHSGWDLAGYAASFDARESRFFIDGETLQFDRPRILHAGASVTGNAWGGLVWLEGAGRHADRQRRAVVSRHSIDDAIKLIAGYSRELGTDLTASAQLQVEAMTSRDRYLSSLAPGVRPVERVSATLHARLQGRWNNQTLSGGAQVFVGREGDTHFNPFMSWSPADGWTVEGGANLFSGKPDTRYGAFKDDANVYVLGRFSF